MDEGRLVGRLHGIRVYPVRSLAGRAVEVCAVGARGLDGDRTWTVVGPDGRVVRAKDAPGMRELAASGDPAADEARLRAALARPVRLVATPTHEPGIAPVHLVSLRAIDRAAAGDVPEGCSADDPRANLLLHLDEDTDERTWTGRRVRVGEAVLEVTRTPKHCLGVYADVLLPGVVRVGDPVRL